MAEGVGPWTDLYAVGVMAYEQVIGRPPFHGTESPMAMLMRHVNEPVTPRRRRQARRRSGAVGLD